MDSARPSNPQKIFTIQEAAQKLAVSVATLLSWNEHNILKPLVTPEGTVGYTQTQLDQFVQFSSQIPQTFETPEVPVVQLGRGQAPRSLSQRFFHWIGGEFYTDDFVKDYLKSQVKESFTFSPKPPSKKVMVALTAIFIVVAIAVFTQQSRIAYLIEKNQTESNHLC